MSPFHLTHFDLIYFETLLNSTTVKYLLISKKPQLIIFCSLVFPPASSFLKQAFEGEYPKLLRLYNELWRRLQQYSASLQGALTSSSAMDSSVDISVTETESQDLFTHGKQDYK